GMMPAGTASHGGSAVQARTFPITDDVCEPVLRRPLASDVRTRHSRGLDNGVAANSFGWSCQRPEIASPKRCTANPRAERTVRVLLGVALRSKEASQFKTIAFFDARIFASASCSAGTSITG